MSSPLVAIVMRTKDRNLLLDRALADCANQIFTDFELWVVNDGGEQAGVDALIEKYRPQLGERLNVIHNETSMGMEYASNQAIKASTGKYVCIHDDDDTWHPEFLLTCVEYLQAHPKDGGVAVRTQIVYEKIEGDKVIETGRKIVWPYVTQFSLSHLLEENLAVPISCCYTREAIETLGGFRADLPVVGDWEFHIRLAAAYEVGYLPDRVLAYWHNRPQNKGVLSNSVFAGKEMHKYFDLRTRDEYLKEYVRQNGVGMLLWQAAMFRRARPRNVQNYIDIAKRVGMKLATLPPVKKVLELLGREPLQPDPSS